MFVYVCGDYLFVVLVVCGHKSCNGQIKQRAQTYIPWLFVEQGIKLCAMPVLETDPECVPPIDVLITFFSGPEPK